MRWRTEAEQEIPAPSAVFHRARSKRFLNLLRGLGASPRPHRVIPPGLPLVFCHPARAASGSSGFGRPAPHRRSPRCEFKAEFQASFEEAKLLAS